jgi:hypothetical protein
MSSSSEHPYNRGAPSSSSTAPPIGVSSVTHRELEQQLHALQVDVAELTNVISNSGSLKHTTGSGFNPTIADHASSQIGKTTTSNGGGNDGAEPFDLSRLPPPPHNQRQPQSATNPSDSSSLPLGTDFILPKEATTLLGQLAKTQRLLKEVRGERDALLLERMEWQASQAPSDLEDSNEDQEYKNDELWNDEPEFLRPPSNAAISPPKALTEVERLQNLLLKSEETIQGLQSERRETNGASGSSRVMGSVGRGLRTGTTNQRVRIADRLAAGADEDSEEEEEPELTRTRRKRVLGERKATTTTTAVRPTSSATAAATRRAAGESATNSAASSSAARRRAGGTNGVGGSSNYGSSAPSGSRMVSRSTSRSNSRSRGIV